MTQVHVRIPGSTSNLGPGFDTLGIALRLYNHVRVTRTAHRTPILTSPIPDDARDGATRIVADAAKAFFRRARKPAFGFEIHLSGQVPMARGLGSSVTVRLGTVAALNRLTGDPLDRHGLFQIVTALEGHPDNAAAAAFGGFTASAMIDGDARAVRIPVPASFRFVTLIPPFEVPTEAARRLVPGQFSKEDTVGNLTRVALITAAFARGDTPALRSAFDDRIHQPYRQQLIPQLPAVIRAGEKAGALGGWLSGSGSTIICLATEDAPAVAAAMRAKLPGSDVRILGADPRGYTVVDAR